MPNINVSCLLVPGKKILAEKVQNGAAICMNLNFS